MTEFEFAANRSILLAVLCVLIFRYSFIDIKRNRVVVRKKKTRMADQNGAKIRSVWDSLPGRFDCSRKSGSMFLF
jgi:hypothetical protein